MTTLLGSYLRRFTDLGPLGLTVVFIGSLFYTGSFILIGPENAGIGFVLGIIATAVAFNSTISKQNTEPYETSLNMVFWNLTAIVFSAILMYSFFATALGAPFGNVWLFTIILIVNYSIAFKSAL